MQMAELLTDEIIKEKLEADGIMEEPDGPWLIEYIQNQYGGKLDTTSDYCDDNYTLKIYSESTCDSYDIYWCTQESRPYVSQDGYYYEDYSDWSDRALDELISGCNVWIENHIWDDMEWDFNHRLEDWWQDIYEDLFDERKEELLDSEDYYED
tara:strand:- start:62 stop:520 length:459 start_codon:yes stop_codon:yes gene_type:complete